MSRQQTTRLVFAGALLSPIPLLAQEASGQSAVSDSAPAARWCLRGRPLPACQGFWLTEFGMAQGLFGGRAASHEKLLTWEFGMMWNRGERKALGLAMFFQEGTYAGGIGVRPRLRSWLSPTTSIDIAPGILLGSERPSFSGHLALNKSNLALTTHVVAFRPATTDWWNPRNSWLTFVGARAGSAPGLALAIIVPVAVVAFFLLACGGGNCY